MITKEQWLGDYELWFSDEGHVSKSCFKVNDSGRTVSRWNDQIQGYPECYFLTEADAEGAALAYELAFLNDDN